MCFYLKALGIRKCKLEYNYHNGRAVSAFCACKSIQAIYNSLTIIQAIRLFVQVINIRNQRLTYKMKGFCMQIPNTNQNNFFEKHKMESKIKNTVVLVSHVLTQNYQLFGCLVCQYFVNSFCIISCLFKRNLKIDEELQI